MNESYRAILTSFVTWLDTLGYADGTIRTLEFGARDFLQWLENRQIKSITCVTAKHVSEYFDYVETRPNMLFKNRLLSTANINQQFFANDKFLEFLHQYGMENAPTPAKRRIKRDEKKIKVLTQQEIKTLYDCIPNTYNDTYHCLSFEQRQAKHYELRLIFALYYGCGLRLSEGYSLCVQDVDFDKKNVFVRQGKNYKDRIIPMNTGVYKELQDYVYNFRHKLKLNHNRLFIISEGSIRRRLIDLQKSCHDESIRAKTLTIHLLRHCIASHLLQNGMSIENIALFLGHSSLDTTQIYTHLV